MARVLKHVIWANIGLLMISGVVFGQVFTQDPGAVVGYTPQGTGQGLYGGFGLDSANDPEFKIYRKFLEQDEEAPLSSATNVDGNAGEARWINVNQRQATPEGLQAPGMFIGQKTHTTADGWVVSNPDQILYFKQLIDTDEDANIADSNRNSLWDTRFGFMEAPKDFIDFVTPNSEQLDLWTGRFDTDAVYAQTLIRRDDTTENTNVTTTQAGGGSFKLMSGDPDTEIMDERDRDDYPLTRATAGSGVELDPGGHVDAGAAYDDPIEVSWGMRPDPEDETLVEFWIKTGNIISSGLFDPTGGLNVAPNPTNDFFAEYTDGRFNWEEAKPVFFAGAQGLVGGEGNMGFFIPGDFGADGAVNLDDFDRWAGDYGGQGTTYSRGDFTQDGITDDADGSAWAGLASNDVKTEALAAVEADANAGGSMYDFNGTGTTDAEDVSFISDLLGVSNVCVNSQGDIDRNGKVEFADFLILSGNFGEEADAAGGDIDCNGKVEFADFLVLSGNFGESVGGAATAQSVPEPSGMVLIAMAALSLGILRRRR